jgi:hypothetical protein
MTDSSTQGIKIVLHPVSDVARAKAVYVGGGHRGQAGRGHPRGATVKEPAHDVGGGRLVATFSDQRPRAASGPMSADPARR